MLGPPSVIVTPFSPTQASGDAPAAGT
jgi:hypothetical protein